jgi:asparagine N-glycosylation enzyme membrane subunit Stt3
MWIKFLVITILFYFFSLLQNSFFIYFNIYGFVPNLIFIFFFTLVFFSKKEDYYQIIFFSILAGLFLDIFSAFGIGISTVSLIVIGILIKKTLLLLKEKEEKYPLVYFTVLFIISFLAYYLFLGIYLYIFGLKYIFADLSWKFLIEIICSLIFAIIEFFIFKIFVKRNIDDKENRFLKNVLQ